MFETLLHSERTNAVIGWLMVGIVAVAVLVSLFTDRLPWAGFSLVILAVALVPPIRQRNWLAMLPWPVLALEAVAVGARVLELYPETAGYVAIAALALLFVVELDAFTPVSFSRRFAVFFGMLTTMAIAAVWIVVQFYADVVLGTSMLGTQTELQRSIVAVTVVGFVLGAFFQWFFARFDPVGLLDGSSERSGIA